MYQSHSQVGKTRVNINREYNKRKKLLSKNRNKNLSSIDKLYKNQHEMISYMDYPEYENYIQDKINNDMFHYKNLSEKQVDELKKRYKKLIKNKEDKYSEIGEEKRVNRKQRKLFREKKRQIVENKQSELISDLLKTISSRNYSGIVKNTSHLSNNPNDWLNNKKYIFTGGLNYGLSGEDKKWNEIYSKLVSQNKANLFDLHSKDSLYNYVYNQ